MEIPQGEISCPRGVPAPLWRVLSTHYNPSQLYAIKYVSELDSTSSTKQQAQKDVAATAMAGGGEAGVGGGAGAGGGGGAGGERGGGSVSYKSIKTESKSKNKNVSKSVKEDALENKSMKEGRDEGEKQDGSVTVPASLSLSITTATPVATPGAATAAVANVQDSKPSTPYSSTGQDTRISLIQVRSLLHTTLHSLSSLLTSLHSLTSPIFCLYCHLTSLHPYVVTCYSYQSFYSSQHHLIYSCVFYNLFTVLIIQGPPGTGKTSAILGMVSALLHRNTDSMTPAPSTSTSTSTPALSGVDTMGGDGLLESNLTGLNNHTVDGRDGKKQRLLLCAPSNAAVDELLLRLLKGVYNSHGKLVVVKVIYVTLLQ